MGDFNYEHLFDVLRRERSRDELQELDKDFYSTAQNYVYIKAESVKGQDLLSEDGEKVRTEVTNAKKLIKELFDRRERKVVLLALNKARTGSSIIDTSALLPSEKEFFDNLVSLMISHRDRIVSLTNNGVPGRSTAIIDSKKREKAREDHDRAAVDESNHLSETPLLKTQSDSKAVSSKESQSSKESKDSAASNKSSQPDNHGSVSKDSVKVKIVSKVPKFLGSEKETYGPYTEGDTVELPSRIAGILVKKGRAEHA